MEFGGSLARKLRFHFFNSWNLKEVSHEDSFFMNDGCDLNVKICMQVANGALAAVLFHFGIHDFPFRIPFT